MFFDMFTDACEKYTSKFWRIHLLHLLANNFPEFARKTQCYVVWPDTFQFTK